MSASTLAPVRPLPIQWRFVAIVGVPAIFVSWWLVQVLTPSSAKATEIPQGGTDLQAYRQIVARVHQGENYYFAAGNVLRDMAYYSSSVFNWRLPTYAWMFSLFPRPEWGQALLVCLALLTLALAYQFECKKSNVARATLLVVLILGAFLWCIDGDAFFSQELWAGVLIALSVCAFAVDQRWLGVTAGLAALFLRELALPYVLVATALALQERRFRELASWGVGLLLFTFCFAWHAWQVQLHLTGSELVDSEGWIQFGGPAFVVQTFQMNVWLFRAPAWVALVVLLASWLGFLAWKGQMAKRVGFTVSIYVFAFLIIGKPVNAYWGLLYIPLLPFALVRLPEALVAFRESQRRQTELPASQPVLHAAWKL